MSTAVAWHSGTATDLGLRRTVNEDRVLADDARGVFLVVDGLGGHAAGEIAAETAVRAIELRMRSLEPDANAESAVREAITEANNRIYQLAESHSEWKGMACVLTIAVVQDDRITVGHVGDSRLYVSWNGHLKKLTSDHSPVGEQEDQGVLTEQEAMNHPRRNEVFRDVGSRPHAPDDADFIETNAFVFRSDAALLLCSDGLSDVLTSAEINAVLDRYDGAPDKTAKQLIDAANQAGGKDNISVVFVPGPEFLGSQSQTLIEARPRHAITRPRTDEPGWRSIVRSVMWLLIGIALGAALWALITKIAPHASQRTVQAPVLPLRARIAVDQSDSRGIQKALESARAGDTVEVAAGDYLGPLKLKDRVNVIARQPGKVKVRVDPYTGSDPGIAIVARGLTAARMEGLSIVADETHPLRTGILIVDSALEIADADISGAIESGIRIEGASTPTLLANFIHANSGPGVSINERSEPRLVGNWISQNGKTPTALRAGIEIESGARPQLANNMILGNGIATALASDARAEKSR